MTDVHPYRAEPDADFADRLERELLRRLAEPAGSSSADTPPLRNASPTERDVHEIDFEVAGGGRRPSWLHLVASGLIAAGLVAALVVVVGDGESERPVAPPDSVVATEPSLVEIAMGFLDAYGAYDAEGALSYLTAEAIDDARPVEYGRTPEEFRLELALLEAFRYQHTITGCQEVGDSPSGVAVRCTFDMHEFGSDAVGLGPYTDNYWDLVVRDGRLTAAVSSWAYGTNGSSRERWEPFARWVRANHPDDVLVLYTDSSQSLFVFSEEAVLLLKQRVDEFVADELASLETARAFIDAWVAGDGDAAAAMFTTDGTWEDLDAEQLPALHDWLRAIGAEYRSDGCTLQPAMGDVDCSYSVENDLTRVLALGPIANRFVVTSADVAITSVNDKFNVQLDDVWQTFADWVADNHPDDVERMYTDDTLSPLLDATSIELWARYVDEFVDDATADITSTATTPEEDS